MLQKIIADAGFTLIRIEDRDCLLQCVENLQLQRDKYRHLVSKVFTPGEELEEHF